MKTLQNYKIKPDGLNEAILHKAVEEGYEDQTKSAQHLKSSYLFFHNDGKVMTGQTFNFYNSRNYPEISAHDFLRLNWTPKVGEDVEKLN